MVMRRKSEMTDDDCPCPWCSKAKPLSDRFERLCDMMEGTDLMRQTMEFCQELVELGNRVKAFSAMVSMMRSAGKRPPVGKLAEFAVILDALEDLLKTRR